MRPFFLFLSFLTCSISFAQPDLPCKPQDLPAWMQQLGWASKPVPCTLPKRAPLHTNTFIGTWSVQKQGGRRFDFWTDKQRVVVQEFNQQGERRRIYFIDLQANVRMNAHVEGDQAYFLVEDLHMPQVGYFREVWSDSVRATGRTESILGAPCQELLGTDGNNDTTYYWRTDKYPALFADMRVWAQWLCREGELELLTALSDEPAGDCLRAQWPKHRFGPEAGSVSILSITPGATPMPSIEAKQRFVAEHRFLWMNNTGIGRLPSWMRTYVSQLEPDTLPAAYTPAPVKRDIPDNKFIGTLTAETPTTILGLRDKRTGRDTTHRVAKYSYWADARRAVLIMDDPDDEGYLIYAVDLDADVVMASHNEMHSHVVPKLYISTLEETGLKEFGRGLELDFQPQGHKRTMLGRECELYTTSERFLSHFWIPKEDMLNPVFDMKNWMVQRMGQRMKDLMMFGVADKPMPMVVMGTQLTSYKQGKAKPPVADLRYYRVKDERLERRRRREEPPQVEVREITVEEMMSGDHDVAVPDMVVAEPVEEAPRMVTEGRGSDMVGEGTRSGREAMDVAAPPPPRTGSGSGTGSGSSGAPPKSAYPKDLEPVMARTTNRFIGTAKLQYTITEGDRSATWIVHYRSDSTRMLVIGQEERPLPSERNRAYLIDRTAGTETTFIPRADSTVMERKMTLASRPTSYFPVAYADSLLSDTRKINGRTCEHRLYEIPTTRRETWVDVRTPSLFHDVLSARKHWGGVEILLRGPMITGIREGMPMEAEYTFHGGERMTMKVLELKSGPVDPKLFTVDRGSWKR